MSFARILFIELSLVGALACGPRIVEAPPAEAPPEPASAPAEAPPPAREKGRRTAGVTNAVIRYNRARFRACYDRARGGDADLAGKVEIVFTIRPDGTVTSAAVDREKSELASDALDACLIGVVKGIAFPVADEEVGSKMHYPFDFKPKGSP